MATGMRWEGFDQMQARINEYERGIISIVHRIAQYWQGVFEEYAKKNAPWTDHTSNARQTLHSFIEVLSGDIVRLFLSHGMDYGLFLEVKYAGRYAIIWPTIQRHLEPIRQMLQGIFR